MQNATSLSDFAIRASHNLELIWNSVAPFPQCIFEFFHNIFNKLNITILDFVSIVSFALLLYLIRKHLTEYIFQRIIRKLKLKKNVTGRFLESLWFLTYYTVAFAIDVHLVTKYGMFKSREFIFLSYHTPKLIPKDLRTFQFIQVGYYLQGLYGTLYVDNRNSDSNAFVFHHLVTIALQLLSYGLGFVNSGIMIECLHDCNDILLHAAKIFHYLYEGSKFYPKMCDHVSTFIFILFTISWLVTRVTMYSYFVIYPVLYNSFEYLPVEMPFSLTFVLLLCCVVLLNTYWLILIFRIMVKFISHGDCTDIREDKTTKKKTN